jgi:hypothetical protein
VSVAYAAPEVLEDSRASAAADVYSLAATLYQLIDGSSPYASADMKTTVRRILTEDPPPLGRAGAPSGLDRVLRRALAKDPTERQESALELAEMIREVQARAGLARTPIPRLTGGTDAAGAAEVGSGRLPEAGAAPSVATSPDAAGAGLPTSRRPDGDDLVGEGDADSGVTIARARPAGAGPQGEDAADVATGPGARRRWVAIGAMAVAALVVAAGVLALGDGDEQGAAPSTTVSGATPTDPFFEFLAPPSDVAVVALGDGVFEVSYVVPDEVDRVEIEYANGPDAGEIVTSTASPAELASDGPTLCVTLRSIGAAGRGSPDFGPVCSN